MQSFLGLLQDSIESTQQSKWWAWHDKQAKEARKPAKERKRSGGKEAKLEKSTGTVTKMMVQTMGICSILV